MKQARRFAWLGMLIADARRLHLGLAVVWGALAVTAPFRALERRVRATG